MNLMVLFKSISHQFNRLYFRSLSISVALPSQLSPDKVRLFSKLSFLESLHFDQFDTEEDPKDAKSEVVVPKDKHLLPSQGLKVESR